MRAQPLRAARAPTHGLRAIESGAIERGVIAEITALDRTLLCPISMTSNRDRT